MDSLSEKRKRMIDELVKGKQIATQLQTLLRDPVQDQDRVVLFEELALQIWTSFNAPLTLLSSTTQIAAAKGIVSAESSKKNPVLAKDRRGCYKRRKTCDSWIKVSPTTEDGRAWRKYGQKEILNSEYPRCYYRCTHKYEGCKATKQVQRIKENPLLYQTTYFNHHTCTQTQLIVDSDPVEPNLLSFKPTIQSKQSVQIVSPLRKDTHTGDICGANSSLDTYWQDFMIGWQGESGAHRPVFTPLLMSSYEDEVASGFQSCGSTSFDDMEVNQLGDIDNLQFDEIY